MLYGDEAFPALSAFDDDHCITSQIVHDLEANIYLSADNTLEDIHLCTFAEKVQTHQEDSPTFKYISKCSPEEKK